jgi:predicted RNase H-like HicB family nuclease
MKGSGMQNRFNIIYTKEKNWIVARCIEIDVVSQGRTIKSAERNIKEAIGLYIDSFGQADLSPLVSKPVLKSVVVPVYAKITPDVRQRANRLPRKAGVRNRSAKRKPRIVAKSNA